MALPVNFKQKGGISASATGSTASTGVAFKIYFVGSYVACPDPAVFLDISETTLTFYSNLASSSTVDSSIGTAGVVTGGATVKLAATLAIINASKNWRAVPVGMLSTDVWGSSGGNLAADVAAATITDSGTSICFKTIISTAGNAGVVAVGFGPEALGTIAGAGPSRRSNKTILGFRNDPAAAVPAGYPRPCTDWTNILQYVSFTQPSTKCTGAYLDIYDATDTAETKVRSALALTDTNSAVTTYSLSDLAAEVMSQPGHRLVARVEASGIGSGSTAILTLNGVYGELV